MARGYEAHESFWADAKMYFAMVIRAIFVGMLIQFLLIGFVVYNTAADPIFVTGTNTKMPGAVFVKYHSGYAGLIVGEQVEIEKELLPYANGWRKLPTIEDYKSFVDDLTDDEYWHQHKKFKKWFGYSFVAYLFSVLYLLAFWGTAKTAKDIKFIRGGQMTPIKELNKKIATAAKKNPLSIKIGETFLPFEMESKHMLILGSAGSGKGVLLNQIAAQITNRKYRKRTSDRVIFYDPKGEFIAKQFVKGDLIFNPFDDRSVGWNIFNEIQIEPDLNLVASSIFAPPSSKSEGDAYWYNSARDVFKAGLIYLKLQNTTTNRDIWNFFDQSLGEIVTALKNTLPEGKRGSLKHINAEDSPASNSIISILQERIGFFEHLVGKDGDFSFGQFVRDQTDNVRRPNLFLLSIQKYKEAFTPLLTLAIDCMVRELLSMPDNPNRRIWFIIDELGTLNRMSSILDLETVGRSKGGCLICANQDLGRIEQEYGRANLKAFVNNFNTSFTFRIREPETAEFLSKAIGEQQVIKTSQSRQMSPSDVGDRKSISEQEKLERLILPTEFQDFPDRVAVLNIAGFGISKIEVPAIYYPERYPSFVMREFAAFGDFGTAEPETAAAISVAKPTEQSETDSPRTGGKLDF